MSRVNSSQLINSRVRIAKDLGIPSYKGWKQTTVPAPEVEWQTELVFTLFSREIGVKIQTLREVKVKLKMSVMENEKYNL